VIARPVLLGAAEFEVSYVAEEGAEQRVRLAKAQVLPFRRENRRQGTGSWPDLPSPRFLHSYSKTRHPEVPRMTVIAGRNRPELTEDFMTELTLHPAGAASAAATGSLRSKTMPASTGSPHARPNSAPAYYLGRPASWWITTHHRRPQPPA